MQTPRGPATPESLGLPEPLVAARQRGRLVFCCGAGVSAPSGVPAFAELVEDICGALAEPLRRHELSRPARVLDRLCRLGHPVRELVAARVREHARDVGWHVPLLCLACDAADGAQPRIVTTNYDTLFELAAARLGRRVTPWAAPHLPRVRRGRPWPGLIYLHGRLDSSADNRDLIMTSADLARAYQRERWAAAFLDGVVPEHDVLLVGLSPAEPVVAHLARASRRLAGGARRRARLWALCRERDRGSWLRRGAEPVCRADFAAIRDTLGSWAAAASEPAATGTPARAFDA